MEPKIIMSDNLPEGVEGYFDDSSNTIVVSSKLKPERKEAVIRHELEHVKQLNIGLSAPCPYVDPADSLSRFMDYFSDPQEVKARAAEKGEEVPEIWHDVFKLRQRKDIDPLKLEGISPTIHRKIIPSREIPLGTGELMNWHSRRLTGNLRPDDPQAIIVERKAIRLHFKHGGNGIIAEEMLKAKGVEASSVAPFTVDIPVDKDNIEALQELAAEIMLIQDCDCGK